MCFSTVGTGPLEFIIVFFRGYGVLFVEQLNTVSNGHGNQKYIRVVGCIGMEL